MPSRPPPPIAQKPKTVKQFRAMYDYDANGQDPSLNIISFSEGDIITFISDLDENWMHARIKGKEGLVPKAYVDQNASQIFPLHEACRRGNADLVYQYVFVDKIPVNSQTESKKFKCIFYLNKIAKPIF